MVISWNRMYYISSSVVSNQRITIIVFYCWSLKVYNCIIKECFAYSFASNGCCHNLHWGLTHTLYQVDACSSSFGIIQAWTEMFFQLNVKASISSEVCLLYFNCYVHSYGMSCMHMCSLVIIDSDYTMQITI